MRRVVVFEHLTLDGVMQAPGRADEDRREDFEHGGWATLGDPVIASVAEESRASQPALLFGRRTYEGFYGFWPRQTDNPFTEVLNNSQKYVASRTLEEPLRWSHSSLLAGEAAGAVAALTQQSGSNLVVLGSGELVQTLMQNGLADAYVLLIHPLVLGSGRRLFSDTGARAALRLVDAKASPSGVVIATYQSGADDR
jgi:dihydrofolate reductase